MQVHDVKCHPDNFQALWIGLKEFEIRVNHRGYEVGDSLHLREYDPIKDRLTGRWVNKRITYMLQGVYGLPKNLCVMQLR